MTASGHLSFKWFNRWVIQALKTLRYNSWNEAFQNVRLLFKELYQSKVEILMMSVLSSLWSLPSFGVRRILFQNSSPPTLLDQLEPNLIWMLFTVICLELVWWLFICGKNGHLVKQQFLDISPYLILNWKEFWFVTWTEIQKLEYFMCSFNIVNEFRIFNLCKSVKIYFLSYKIW